MPPAALLERATELLRAVLTFDAPADGIVSAYFQKQRALGPRERHALAETVYAVLRQRLRLQHLAQSGSGPLERRLAIAGWQGEERSLQSALEPHEREWLAAVRAVDLASLPDKLRHNLPTWLAEALRHELGDPEFQALAESLQSSAPLDLRVNTMKARRDDVRIALQSEGIAAAPTPYSPWGLRIAGRPAVNRLPLFKEGMFEVQDEGSQLLAMLVDPRRGEMVVDFCAGAGGKTLLLGALMRSTGRLYAFDVADRRLAKLRPRVARAGLSNVHPVCISGENDARVKRLAGKVDRVLVDAPCSGLGTLRRNPDLKWRQTPESVAELARKQSDILAGAARLPKAGGRLVYATCSLLPEENSAIVDAFLAAHPDYHRVSAAEILAAQGIAARCADDLVLLPHVHGTDGFFAAVLERT